MTGNSIIWRRLDHPGHDAATLRFHDPFWRLEGAAVFVEDRQISRLEYRISCDTAWNTVMGEVSGRVGEKSIDLKFSADPARRWRCNGNGCEAVDGCIDVDLSFTPATNLLPIRRLQLPVGKEVDVRSALLRFPSLTFEVLEQTYHRVGTETYRYRALDGEFVRYLTVNDLGFVTHYPGFWEIEAGIF